MPNAFTPNGDGFNDIFKVKYPFYASQFDFTIYDRWRNKIFETNDITKGWDGTYEGTNPSEYTFGRFLIPIVIIKRIMLREPLHL